MKTLDPQRIVPLRCNHPLTSNASGGYDGPVSNHVPVQDGMHVGLLRVLAAVGGGSRAADASLQAEEDEGEDEDEGGGNERRVEQAEWEKYAHELEGLYPDEKGVGLPAEYEDDPVYAKESAREEAEAKVARGDMR